MDQWDTRDILRLDSIAALFTSSVGCFDFVAIIVPLASSRQRESTDALDSQLTTHNSRLSPLHSTLGQFRAGRLWLVSTFASVSRVPFESQPQILPIDTKVWQRLTVLDARCWPNVRTDAHF